MANYAVLVPLSSRVQLGSSLSCGIKVLTAPKAAGSHMALKATVGNRTESLAENIPYSQESVTVTLPLALACGIPTSLEGSCVLTLQCYNGTSLTESTTANLSIWMEAGQVWPSASLVGHNIHRNSGSITVLYQGLDGVSLEPSYTLQYGAGLKSLSLTGTELTAGATSVDRFRESGQHTYTLEVTDSRGLTSTAVMMKNVVSYVPLVISATAQRAKDQNTPDATATGLRVAIRSSKAIAASRVSIRYRLASSGSWIATRNQALSVGETVVYIAGALATGSSYVVQVNATDGAMEVPYSEDIGVGTAYVFLHVDAAQKRFGVGALVETNSRFVIGSDMVPYWGTEKLATEKYVTDNEKDTTYGAATTSTAGLMSAADKVKLNGIATGANAYSLPAATGSVRGGITVGSGLSISGDKLSSINQAGITLVATSGPGALNSSTPYTTGYLKGVYYVVCVLGNGQRNGIWFVLPQLGNGTPIVTQVSATGSQITVEVGKYEAQDGSGDSCRITVRAAAGNSTVWVYQL